GTGHAVRDGIGPGTPGRLEHAVDRFGAGDVMGERDRREAAAAPDRTDLGLELGFVPEREHHALTDRDHDDSGRLDPWAPSESVHVEPACDGDVAYGQSHEGDSLIHVATLAAATDIEVGCMGSRAAASTRLRETDRGSRRQTGRTEWSRRHTNVTVRLAPYTWWTCAVTSVPPGTRRTVTPSTSVSAARARPRTSTVTACLCIVGSEMATSRPRPRRRAITEAGPSIRRFATCWAPSAKTLAARRPSRSCRTACMRSALASTLSGRHGEAARCSSRACGAIE